jgi:hypothetical protein
MIGFALAMLGAEPAQSPDLAWLEGEWCTRPAQGRQTCEHWGPMRGGTMLGTSQTVRDGKTRDYEFMRIELVDGVAVFHGSPRGAPAVPFREAARSARNIVFANPGHDYPQRIRYWREAMQLYAEIALADGSKPMRWVYWRVG